MQLTFWGATRTVTGSFHLITTRGRRVALDCGLFQGSRQLARERNREFPVHPGSVDALVLSHAHIDHAGNIPQFVKLGFKNRIHATAATTDLARVLLRDSGHIQEKDAEFLNRKLARRREPLVEPLYTLDDAERCLHQFKSHYYRRPFNVLKDQVTAEYFDAGHLLGSAFIQVQVFEHDREIRLTFSGDVGRKNMPILRDPETPGEADYLILESTYGNRVHEPIETAEESLLQAVKRVVERRGKIVIPAFSVGRTQELVYSLNNMWNAGRLPRIPIYVDSPLSVNATEVFRHHPECYDEDVRRVFLTDPDPFGFESLIYVRDVQTSKSLNAIKDSCIIISSSGMAEAGRVLHHLANTIADPKNAVFIVGFQAENTLGRKLVDKLPEVRILGDTYPLRAEVVKFNAFSGHADSLELRQFARNVAASGRLKKIFLVHGEETQMLALQASLIQDLPGCEILMPERGQTAEL